MVSFGELPTLVELENRFENLGLELRNPVILSKFLNLLEDVDFDVTKFEESFLSGLMCFKSPVFVMDVDLQFRRIKQQNRTVTLNSRFYRLTDFAYNFYLARIVDSKNGLDIIMGGHTRRHACLSVKLIYLTMLKSHSYAPLDKVLYTHVSRMTLDNAWNLASSGINGEFECVTCGAQVPYQRNFVKGDILLSHFEQNPWCAALKSCMSKKLRRKLAQRFSIVNMQILKKQHKKDVQKQKFSSPKHKMVRAKKNAQQQKVMAEQKYESRELIGNAVNAQGKVKTDRPKKYAHLCKHEWSFIQPKLECEPEKFICFDRNYLSFLERKVKAAEADVDKFIRNFDLSKGAEYKNLCEIWIQARITLEQYRFKHRVNANKVVKQSLFSVTVEHKLPMLDEVTKILSDMVPKYGGLAVNTFTCANFIIDMWQAFQDKSIFNAVRKAIGFFLTCGLPTELLSDLTQYLLEEGKKLFGFVGNVKGNAVTAQSTLGDLIDDFEIDSLGVISLASIIFTVISALCLKNLPGPQNIDTFMRRCDLLPKCAKGISDLFQFITKMVKKAWSHITGEVVEGEFDDPDKLPKCMEEITDKITELDIKYVQRKTAMDIGTVKEIHDLYDRHATINKALLNKRGLSMKITSFWTSQALKLVKLKQLADISGAEFKKTRTQPIVLQFFGAPGQGKTESVKYFQLAILKFLGKLNHTNLSEDVMRDQEVFYRQIDNEFWDGYSNQTIVCYDDFGTMKDSSNQPNKEFLELIHIAGAAPYALHMSDVKDKANTYFDSPIVMLTCNHMDYDVNSLTNPEALTRRITARIKVEAKKEYCKTIVDKDGHEQQVIDPFKCWSAKHMSGDRMSGNIDFNAWKFTIVDEQSKVITYKDFDDTEIFAENINFHQTAEYVCTLADIALARRNNETHQIQSTVRMFETDSRFSFLTRSRFRQLYEPVEICQDIEQNLDNLNKCLLFMYKDRKLTMFGPGSIAVTAEKLEQLALENVDLLSVDYLQKVADTFDIRIDLVHRWKNEAKQAIINKSKQIITDFVIGFQDGTITLLKRRVPKHVSIYDEIVRDIPREGLQGNTVQQQMFGLSHYNLTNASNVISRNVASFARVLRGWRENEEAFRQFLDCDDETRKRVVDGPLDAGQLSELERLAHRENLNRHMAHVYSVPETMIERISAPFRNFWRVYRSRLLVPRFSAYNAFANLIERCQGNIILMQEQMVAMKMDAWDYFDHVSQYTQQVGKSLFKDLKEYMTDLISKIPYKTVCTTLLVCAAAVPVLYTMYKAASHAFGGSARPKPNLKRNRKQSLANLKRRLEAKLRKEQNFEQFQIPTDFYDRFIDAIAEEDPEWFAQTYRDDEVPMNEEGFEEVKSKPTNQPSVGPKPYADSESKPTNQPSVGPRQYSKDSKPTNTPSVPPRKYGILGKVSNSVAALAGKMFRSKDAPPIEDMLKAEVFEDTYLNVYPDENSQIAEVTRFCEGDGEKVDNSSSLNFCKDFGSEALLKNIIPSNMYYISGVDESNHEYRLLQGTFLKGRYLLTNAHILEAADMYDTFSFTSMFSTQSFKVPIKELKFKYVKQFIPPNAVDVQWGEEYKDAIIILMPNSVPQHRDITRHFISRQDQNQFHSARAMYVCVNEIGKQPMLVARAGHVTSADVNWLKPLSEQTIKYGGMDVPVHVTFQYNILASLVEDMGTVKHLNWPNFWNSKVKKEVSTVTRDYYWTADIDSVGGDCGSLLVITEPAVSKKIVGMHFAGQKVGGLIRNYCMALTREDLEETFWDKSAGQCPEVSREIDFKPVGLRVKGFSSEKMGVILDVDRAGTSNAIPESGVHLLGTAKPVFRAKKSRIRPSAIHGVFEPITKPANLKPVLVGEEMVDPLYLGLKKITPPPVCVDSETVTRVAREIFDNVIRQQKPDPQYARVLTHEEAITGIDGVPYLESMKRQTSAGYPWTQFSEFEGEMEGKNKWLGSGEEFIVDDPNLKRVCEQRIAAGERGERYPTVWTDTLKDERRPIAKVDAGKTRVFTAGPMDFSLVFRMYFLGFMAQTMTDRVLNGVAVGIDPTGSDWDGLARKLKSMGPCVIAGDFENFDGTLLSQLLIQACIEINRWYKENDPNWKIEDDNVRLSLIHEVTNSIHICENSIYMWTHGLTSGCPITAILNSIYNLMVCYLAWLIIMEEKKPEYANIKCYVENVYAITYGDDNVLNISLQAIDLFNMKTISEAFTKFGMKYTDEAKTGLFSEFKSLSEVAFLKRGFVWRYGRYEAPLDANVVKEMTNWVHGDVNKILNTNLNIETALAEASLHDKEFYDWFQLQLRAAVSSVPYYSPQPIWQSYEGMRKAVFNKYYLLGQ